MVNLNDLIKVYDNALSQEMCNTLIELYETNPDYHEKHEINGNPLFTQFNFTEATNYSDDVSTLHRHIMLEIHRYLYDYFQHVDRRCFPKQYGFEELRIKKYKNDGKEKFHTHVDVKDYSTARRFIAFMFYLNTVEEGGETVFTDLTIKPEAGKLLVFPPLWMYPHEGKAPVSNEKYLLSTYLHYV